MKSFATFYPQVRRAPAARSCRAHQLSSCSPDTCVIRMTVDAASVTALRQLAMRVCGESLEFMRIALCAGGKRIQVWLCVRLPFAALLSASIVLQMPGTEINVHAGQPGATA